MEGITEKEMADVLQVLSNSGIAAAEFGKNLRKALRGIIMTKSEEKLAKAEFALDNYIERFNSKIEQIKAIALDAAIQYEDTYRQGGKIMRFSDVFRKYKRLEKEFIGGTLRKREKTEDDIRDLIVYAFVMWIYLDELKEMEDKIEMKEIADDYTKTQIL